MPIEIGTLISNLALKAGIPNDNEDLKSLLASPELAAIKVPDALVTTMDSGLLSVEAAKNNHPDIKKKYFADAFDGMDKQLLSLVSTDTFDEADLEEIKAERSTTKKAELIVSKLKAAKSKATGADKVEINKQLEAAHAAAKLAKDEVGAVRNEYEGKIKDIKINAALNAMLGKYNTKYDDLPDNAKRNVLTALLNDELQNKQAAFSADENGNLTLVGKDGANVFGSNHVQLTPASFIDATLAPILKVSSPAASQPNPAARPNPTATPAAGAANVQQDRIKSHADRVLAEMNQPKPSMMG